FEVSPFSSLEPDSIKFYYEYLTKENSRLKSARLTFKKLKYRTNCSRCGISFETVEMPVMCPGCAAPNKIDQNIDDIRITAIHAEE
ncbi:MAG: hydrogenase maturation nickel metallochaperone HypA, partial [Actinobacteria bacterium]|nr:hydrogenase maturation nickel metallochaperone HypA [Actinomycetota bacterium]